MTIYTLNQRKNIVLGIIIALGVLIALSFKTIFTAVLGAIILYTLLRPLYINLAIKRKWPHSFSAILLLLLSFIILVLPFFTVSILIKEKVIDITNNPKELDNLVLIISKIAGPYINEKDLVKNLFITLQGWALHTFSDLINRALVIFLNVFVMYFTLYFMLIHYVRFENTLLKYMPFKKQSAMRFAVELKRITYSNVIGQSFISISQGALLMLGFLLFGLRDPFFWGIIAGFLSFLPLVGPPFIFVPAGILCLSQDNTLAGVGIILWGFLLVNNIDNVLRFVIAKRLSNTHPLVSIIGAIIGIPLFGVLGLIIGPVLLAYFILLVNMYEARYIRRYNAFEQLENEREILTE